MTMITIDLQRSRQQTNSSINAASADCGGRSESLDRHVCRGCLAEQQKGVSTIAGLDNENGARKGVGHYILLAGIKIDCSILVVNSFEYDILSGLNHRAAIHLYR